jgi:F-type H+-transporting ATPase subunit delta
VSGDLFGVVDVLDATPQLRRALTDPNVDASARQKLAQGLLTGKVSPLALDVVSAAVGQPWSSGRALASAVERQAVRASLAHAEQQGRLDDVEEALFRFGRIVDADRELRGALANPAAPLGSRRDLVATLLTGKAQYLNLSAALRRRVVATVRVAAPLTGEQQARLAATLTRQTGRAVNLHVVVDPAVVGGMRVELGDEVIDGTVAGRLADARRHLA